MLPRIYDGSGKPAPERTPLRAGKVTVDFETGMLRYLRLGSTEIVRGIYVAVRDQNWGTIPAVLRDLRMDIRADSFDISFTNEHQQGDIHFIWRGTITGAADGNITFTFDGEALTSFKRNRIGFCVLHPNTVAGKPVTVEHVNGETEQGEFPLYIAPHQPYFEIRALTHETIPGVRAEVRMEGDTFEMEDQRNWTDASFKTYCTPLSQPFPVRIEAGTKISQKITVRLIGDASHVEVKQIEPTLHLESRVVDLPRIGFSFPSHGDPLSPRQIEWLKPLAIDKLHVEIDFSATNTVSTHLTVARQYAETLQTSLFFTLHLIDEQRAEEDLWVITNFYYGFKGSRMVLPLMKGKPTTPVKAFALAQIVYERSVAVSTGTDGYFTQLNRNRPFTRDVAYVVYSVNPQVHAFDNASLIETLPGMAATVETAKVLFPNTKIAVAPITFKIRHNPDATTPEAPTPPGQLPRQVDPRQMSLFGAGWTMGAIASLALAGADSLTFFETTGWLGIMERESGSPLPDLFPSIPGGVFPMYHVFADVGEFPSATVRAFTSSQPLKFSGLALQSASKRRLLVANHMQERQTVTITGINGAWDMKSLDEHTADFAMRDPEGYRAAPGQTIAADENGLRLDLLPYAVVRLDQDITL